MNDFEAARALGWASLVIGAVEILGQGMVEKDVLGIDDHPHLMTSLGLRESASGVTILSQKEITPTLAAGLWSRVAGDVMDLALLATAAPRTRRPGGFAFATLAVAGIMVADVVYASRIQRRVLETGSSDNRSIPTTTAPRTFV